ncbi:hypothetical protein [Georgenia deserti]|uniref:Potassium transporter Trk n=1 Tax=Georgenia deserti TaxID=2093781 RepID=A0ABW4KY23_9MICO
MTQRDSEPTPQAPDGDAEPGGEAVPVGDAIDRRAVRRAPRYGRFIVLGIVLGAVLSFALSAVPPSQEAVETGQVLARSDLFWLLFLTLGFFGGILGALVALLVDRVSLRSRERRMRAVRDDLGQGTADRGR